MPTAMLAALAVAASFGAEWHVNHERGDDNWPGTEANPFKTFKRSVYGVFVFCT